MELTELEIKDFVRAVYLDLQSNYSGLSRNIVEHKTRDVLAGKVEGIISKFIQQCLERYMEPDNEEVDFL